jgi:Helitron helicase-like domain at N-terminus
MTQNEKQLLLTIRSEIMRVNPFIRAVKDIIEVTGALNNESNINNYTIILSNEPINGEHRGRYNLPTTTCVSAIVLGNEDSLKSTNRRVVVHMRSRNPSHIPSSHSAYDPLAYVLTHMHGDTGWTTPTYMPQSGLSTDDNKSPTLMEFYSYRGHTRDNLNGAIVYDSLLVGGQLMHQYWVDQWIKIEESRLNYIKNNQKALKADSYDVIRTAFNRNESDIGNWIILPSSFNGSPRHNVQNFQDLLAIQRKFGKPDYFITFTCNSKWIEYST